MKRTIITLSILAIAGFLAYWLWNNIPLYAMAHYHDESWQIKAEGWAIFKSGWIFALPGFILSFLIGSILIEYVSENTLKSLKKEYQNKVDTLEQNAKKRDALVIQELNRTKEAVRNDAKNAINEANDTANQAKNEIAQAKQLQKDAQEKIEAANKAIKDAETQKNRAEKKKNTARGMAERRRRKYVRDLEKN